MRKPNKKGFTIVELVIVIAVIAILAAVLIPTFTGVVANAEKAAAKSNAKAEYQKYTIENSDAVTVTNDFIYKYNDLYVAIINGQVSDEVYKTEDEAVAAFGTTDNDGVAEPKYEIADAEATKVVDEDETITFTGLYEVTPIA